MVHFPPGPEGAHQLSNRSEEPARYVLASAVPTPEIIEYPDSGKIASMARTETTAGGVKTRRFDNIVAELETAFRIHREHGSRLGGVHFELTGEDVTECIGGARGLEERDLSRAYRSQVDPRLNY